MQYLEVLNKLEKGGIFNRLWMSNGPRQKMFILKGSKHGARIGVLTTGSKFIVKFDECEAYPETRFVIKTNADVAQVIKFFKEGKKNVKS